MTKELSVFSILKSPYCITYNDGEKVYNRLFSEIENGDDIIELSFEKITDITSAFWGNALGPFYRNGHKNEIDSRLELKGLSKNDREYMNCIKDDIIYYSNNIKIEEEC